MEEHVAAVAESLEGVLESAHRALLDLEGVAVRMEGPVLVVARRRSRKWALLAAVVMAWVMGSMLSTRVPGPTMVYGHWRLDQRAHIFARVDHAWDAEMAPRPTP